MVIGQLWGAGGSDSVLRMVPCAGCCEVFGSVPLYCKPEDSFVSRIKAETKVQAESTVSSKSSRLITHWALPPSGRARGCDYLRATLHELASDLASGKGFLGA